MTPPKIMAVAVDHQVFADVDEHAQALSQWRQCYQQISPGRLSSALTQLTADGLTLFWEEFNHRITQRGVSPNGQVVTFGLIALPPSSPPAWFQGCPLGVHDFLCIPGDTEFTLHLPTHAKVLGITLPRDQWKLLIPEELHATFHRLGQRQRFSVSPHEYHALCRLTERTIARQMLGQGRAEPAAMPDELEILPSFIASLVSGSAANDETSLTHRVRADIVERCRKIAMRPAETPVALATLCAALKISPRTLSNSFVAVTGTSPASYLRSVRLAEVRKFLSATPRASTSISDAAARWGFSSIHFADLYQRQYGELPSATRRKGD